MDDALFAVGRVDVADAEFRRVLAQGGELRRALRVGDGQDVALRVLACRGRQVVVGNRDRKVGAAHLAASHA